MKFLYCFVCLLFISCGSVKPETPALTEQSAPRAVQPKSVIILPLSVNLSEYYTLADKQVPNAFNGNQDVCEGVSFTYHFERDPLKLSGSGNQVKIGVSGQFRIKMSYCPKCSDLFSAETSCLSPRIPFSCGYGEPMRKMKLEYLTDFELTENYGVSTKTKLNSLKAIDPCQVTVFRFDATDKLLEEVEKALSKLAKDIDKQTKAISFKKEAQQLWTQAQQSYEVKGFGNIQLRPQSLSIQKPKIVNNTLKTALVLEAFPVFSSVKKEVPKSAIPDLQLIEKTASDTLLLFTDMELDYDSLSLIINRLAAGTKLDLKGKEVIIDSLHIAGAEGQNLVFRVHFSGKKTGVLFITGQPVFEPVSQQIQLDNVQFEVKTKSLLLKSAKWLFSERILKEIEKASKQDLKPQLKSLQNELSKSIKFSQGGFNLSGNITKLQVESVFPETHQLNVRILAKGNLELKN